jgi:hypothetical protein
MAGVFDKLNLKEQQEIVVLDAPETFETEIKALRRVKIVRTVAAVDQITFALAFATLKSQIDRLSKSLASKAVGDAVLWFAYPKGTSKRFKCDFNRDNGWDVIQEAGWDAVRQIAIDADWSALRFRRREFINRRTEQR